MKIKALLVIYIILQSTILPTTLANSEEVIEIQDLSDLLETVEAIELEVDPEVTEDGDEKVLSYTITGTEIIDGKQCWVVDGTIDESNQVTDFVLWVEQETGTTLKAETEDMTLEGSYAEDVGDMFFDFFKSTAYTFWDTYGYQEFVELENNGQGESTPLDNKAESYGETTLEIWGMRYTGSIGDVEDYDIEIWYAPTQFGGILTYLSMEYTRDGTSHHQKYELKSITLSEEQQVPTSFHDLVDSETGSDTEPEPTPDPANINYDSITASPMTIEAGNSVTVTITLENTGDEQGTETVDLYINNELTDSETLSVEGGTTETVSFTVTMDEVGTYNLEAGDKATSITVTEPGQEPSFIEKIPVPPFFIVLGIAAAVLLGSRQTSLGINA